MKISGRTIFDNRPIEITITDGVVKSIDSLATTESKMWIAPALTDIQVNGFFGFDLNTDTVKPSDVCGMIHALWRVGTGLVCPTIVTASYDSICNSLRAVIRACDTDPKVSHSILGIHLEGPYISTEDGPRGAHPLEHVKEPDWDEFQRWQDIAEGRICIVTLAPEKRGAIPFIEKLVANGIVVSIGHTNATAENIQDAINVGAKLSTHLGNGAHAIIRRHPNYIWEQLAADDLWASLIVDGHHLPPSVVKSMIRAKTLDRCLLVSDAVYMAGLEPGNYRFAGKPVELTTDRSVRLAGTEYLAGSAIELARGIENCVRFAGISIKEAISLATIQPMNLLGVRDEVDNKNDLIVFEWDSSEFKINIVATIVDGYLVYHANSNSVS